MENSLIKTLMQLGLTEKEIKLLKALYLLGPTSIQEVTRKSRIQRSTSYLLINQLTDKGFIKEDFKGYKKIITALEPRGLLRMLAAKQRTIKRQEIEFTENLPQIETLYKTSTLRPHIQFFEGTTALFTVWEDILKTKNEILLWTNQETENLFFTKALHAKFIKERIAKRIPIRALAVNNRPGRALKESDHTSLRRSKLLPIQTMFRSETYLYDNKIAILDHEADITGIIIESEPVASTQRAIFEMTWVTLKSQTK